MAQLSLRPRPLSGNAMRTYCALIALLLAPPALAAPQLAPKFAERDPARATLAQAQATSSLDPLWVGYGLPGMSGPVRAIGAHGGRVVVGSDAS